MGGWDIYCAFCAGPFAPDDPFCEEEEESEELGYDRAVLPEEGIQWLNRPRVLGFNKDSFRVNKCFITGVGDGTGGFDGELHCQIGDDENVPKKGNQSSNEVADFSLYSTYDPDDQPLAFPGHASCFQIFAQALRYLQTGRLTGLAPINEISKELLYSCMKGSFDENRGRKLELDYGEFNEQSDEQYWCCFPGDEAWVSDPLQSSQISQFMDSLTTRHVSPGRLPSPEHARNHQGFFKKLADEIICEILLYLPYDSLKNLVLSGVVSLPFPHIQAFWKRRLFNDMPWLWDLPPTEEQREWFTVYQDLRKQCFTTTPTTVGNAEGKTPAPAGTPAGRDTSLVLGLTNRRRIWTTCSQLARIYIAKENYIRSHENTCEPGGGNSGQEFGEGLNLHMPLVSSPVQKDTRSFNLRFFDYWEHLDAEAILTFYFGKEGFLCWIGSALAGEGSRQRTFGEMTDDSVQVSIPASTWVKGFEFNIRGANDLSEQARLGISGLKVHFLNGESIQVRESNGAKRQMLASPGMSITGLVGEIAVSSAKLPNSGSQESIIQRIGLLQDSRFPSSTPPTISTLSKQLWDHTIPPTPLTATPYTTGYWTTVRSFDLLSQQHLIFGTCVADLALVTGISGDSTLKSLAVHYRNETSKVIGLQDMSLKRFAIDGPGGERVVKVEVGMNSLPQAIKITTNRNRFAFFGQAQKNSHMVFEPDVQRDENERLIAGIYASFGYKYGDGDPACTSISILSAPVVEDDGMSQVEIQGVSDETGFNPPPVEGETRGIHKPRYLSLVDEKDYENAKGAHW